MKLIAVMLGLTLCSVQAASIDTELQKCRQISQDLPRLLCYDQIGSPPIKPEENSAPSQGALASNTTQTVQKDEQEFGLEHKTIALDKAQELSLVLKNVSTNPYGIKTFTFANGQIWRQTSKETFPATVGKSYVLERGAFNSFSLKEEGQNRKTSVRREK